jgi:hypothetical protein
LSRGSIAGWFFFPERTIRYVRISDVNAYKLEAFQLCVEITVAVFDSSCMAESTIKSSTRATVA